MALTAFFSGNGPAISIRRLPSLATVLQEVGACTGCFEEAGLIFLSSFGASELSGLACGGYESA